MLGGTLRGTCGFVQVGESERQRWQGQAAS